jgi:RNA-directed DNA polymerase
VSELLNALIEGTGLSEAYVRRIISRAPISYKEYTIPKRDGTRRWIAQPAREVKALQYVLLERFLKDLPVHPAATAYRPGRSIRNNVEPHADNGPIFKFDFENFFPSILAADWHFYCEQRGLFNELDDRAMAANILFHRSKRSSILRLAIGAPSSPHLSNLLMYQFDARIVEIVQRDFVTYTRYADDLTFSAKRTGYLVGVERALKRVIQEIRSPKLRLNQAKTVLATKKYHRQVTGLVISNDGKVSLGRDRKRLIRAALHRESQNKLPQDARVRLSGLLAFVHAVEPEFLDRLVAKYGHAVIDRLKREGIKAPEQTDRIP